MPDISRLPLRMNCTGIDLVHPIDRMPEGSFAYLFNARILEEGRIDGRPGYTQLMALSDPPNSVRRLNDPSQSFAPTGYIYVGGGGPNLYAGPSTSYAKVDIGYSGDPLSLIPFRPEQSPESWMYVYDRLKMSKVRPDGVVRAIGVAPPNTAPTIELAAPAEALIVDGQATTGWTNTGIATGPAQTDRRPSAVTITDILYDSGNTGWCCIHASISDVSWAPPRSKVILNSGGGNQESVTIRESHPGSSATTLLDILYDIGSDGLCTIKLASQPPVDRNSLLSFSGPTELVRALEVIQSPDGTTYCIRCVTTNTRNPGDACTVLQSWRVYTTQTHAAAETVTVNYLLMTQAAAGTGGVTDTVAVNASVANGRPVDAANDYLHISMFFQNAAVIGSVQLMLALDATPSFSFTDPGNAYVFTLSGSALQVLGSSASSWVEIVVPISSGVRFGSDQTKTLASIQGVAIQVVTSAASNWGFDWLYLFGTYGPVVQPNSPVGLSYATTNRDSSTGAKSVPSPITRYQLFPLREGVIITPVASTQAGVDSLDIYRIGGTITSLLYVGTATNAPTSPASYTDGLPDTSVLVANQAAPITSLQPWPLLVSPWTGTCQVVGTSVVWLSGSKFNTALVTNSAIIINGTVFQTFGNPESTTKLQLTQDGGDIAIASFTLASPTLAGQPLPFAFGSLEGPFAPVIFALGDPLNGGLLYFTNFSDADGASDANTLELSTPSQDLVSGDVWKGMAIVGSREDIFVVRYSYLTQIGASGSTSYQWSKVSAPSGMWSRWACCACPIGVAYLGRDGIYIASDTTAVSITDERLYPLFPHDGQAAEAINSGSNIILPVDMTQLQFLHLTYCDESLRFSYKDTGGNFNTLVYEIYKKRWLLNNYGNNIIRHYLVEPSSSAPNDQEILMLSVDSDSIMQSGGNTDNGKVINTIVLTPSADGGDERAQKLYVDEMVQADGNGTVAVAASFDNAQSFSPVTNFSVTGSIQQFLQNIASLADLTLHRNIGAKFAWTGGPDGPRLYAWEMSAFLQPYLSQFFVTQFIPFSFPGWKHMRRMYPAIISNSPVLMTIKTQDDRTYGPFTIPSTGGQYRILPQMLPHGVKDLAFALQLDGQGQNFAFFPQDFTIETKQWTEESYINLAVFRA